MTATFADAIAFAKKKLDEIRKVAEDQTKFDKIIDDINQERSSLFEKTDAMTEDDISMILAYDFILEYGATFANEKSDKSTVEGLESSLEAIKDLVNTGRGGLINEMDLKSALENEVIAAAYLDVLSQEPPSPGHILQNATRCFITPHIAWATGASRKRLIGIVADNIRAFQKGKPQNVVD